ncbi:MAG: PKD domain-containing protein, partial [Acidobacteriota bacterium]
MWYLPNPRLFVCLFLIIAGSAVGGSLGPPARAAMHSPPGSNEVTPALVKPSELPPGKEPPNDKPGLPLNFPAGINAVATGYLWSQTTGTYTEITGGTVLTTSCDDTSYNNNSLPFSFTYDGTAYTAVSIQCNGFIAMGTSVTSSYAPLSTGTTNNVISALGMDLQTGTSNSEIRYETLGTSPDRVFVIQYKNFRNYSATGDAYNFQIRLHETSNVVRIVYGDFSKNATSRSPQVGLRGASNTDFNNRSSSTGWTNTVAGTLNNATVTLSTTYLPPSGLTWDWTPIAPSPSFVTSSKTAPAQVSLGSSIAYTVTIINSGTADATAATMVDPIPAGTTYNADVTCSAGTCGFDGTNVTWNGTVAVGATVTVSFSVDTDGAACGQLIENQATISDPAVVGGPVTKSASTLITSMINDLLTEGFEVSVPPPGWTETIVNDPGTDPDWTRESAGTNPTITPHGGSYMAKFNSFNASAGASARLASQALNFTQVNNPRVTFWMSHDTGYASSADQLQVQVSTDGGATWTNVGAPIMRYDPAFSTPGWGYHVVTLTGLGGAPSVMVGFLGISGYGNNFYLDDVTIQDICGQPMVQVWPTQSGSACPGSSTTYTLNVKNVSLVSDTISITRSGNLWPTNVVPTSLLLGPNETGQVQVTVNVPWSAVPGSTDAATVTGTAQGSGATGSATVTTTAFAGGMDTAWVNKAVGSDPSLYWGGSYYYDGNVCVVGGLTGPTGSIVVSGAHWCYNIATATWTSKAPMPNPRMGTAYGLIGNKFYMAGGFDINFIGYTDLQIYDIATDTWSTGAALPTARGGPAGGVVAGKLYSAGGSGSSSFPTDCPTYEYDPVADVWATKTSCPLQGGYGFDLGGSVGSTFWGKLFAGGHFGAYYGWYAFDPVADTWTTLADLPYHKTPLIVENPNTGEIYSIGGLVGWVPQNATWKYDVPTNTWTNLNVPLNTSQGGSLGPPQGSFGDPTFQGFWTAGGTVGSGSLSPAPFESWKAIACPTCTPPSSVDFSWNPPSPLAGQTVTFTGSATGTAPLTYSWTFGDSSGGSGNPVDHTYAAGGTYGVTLEVSNVCGSATASHDVTVTALTASISLAKTVGTAPAVCATTDAITVPAGTTVYYCYEVT